MDDLEAVMKLASYNVENLFQRARALNQATWQAGKNVLKMHAALNTILGKAVYSAADKKKIIQLMKDLGIAKADDGGQWVILRQNHGHMLPRPPHTPRQERNHRYRRQRPRRLDRLGRSQV